MQVLGIVLLAAGALLTYLSRFIARKLNWDDSPTSPKMLAIKFGGYLIALFGALAALEIVG